MIRAGSMTYAVFLLFLSTVLSFLLFSLYQNFDQSYARLETSTKLLDNCHSGIALGVSALNTEFQYQENNFEGMGSLRVKSRPWGCFKSVSSQAEHQGDNIIKAAIVATENEQLEGLAIWLAPEKNFLKVAGNTTIQGDLKLPSGGIKSENIGGQDFTGEKLYEGSIRDNPNFILGLTTNIDNYWNAYLNGRSQNALDSNTFFTANLDLIDQSFHDITLLYEIKGSVRLNERSFRGNVIIRATDTIVIGKEAEIDHLVLVAPVIIMEADASIRANLVAQTKVDIHNSAKLKFPSSILLLSNRSNKGQIQIDSNAVVEGLIIAKGVEEIYNKIDPLVQIKSGARINGTIICFDDLDLRGSLSGHLLSRRLVYKNPDALYRDVLFNASVSTDSNRANLGYPKYSVASAGKRKEEIVRWLN